MPKSPITYYGGKATLTNWILPVLASYPHTSYIEPFGGGASILLAKPPGFDVYNDLYSDLVNMWRIIRDRETFNEFGRIVSLIPCSREAFWDAYHTHRDSVDPVERAAKFFVVCRQTFSGKQARTGCGWKHSIKGSRGQIAQVVNSYLAAVYRLPEVHERLQTVQIENMDAIECIKKYSHDCIHDGSRCCSLTYRGPPYPLDTRSGGVQYQHEMTDDQHKQLASTLLSVPGHKVLSTYESPLYEPLLSSGWEIIRKSVACTSLSKVHAHRNLTPEQRRRTECLYCSPGRLKTLF